MSTSEIKDLITSQGYSQSIIPQLEQHLLSQSTSTTPYDFNANRTLVKLYQFFPSSSNAGYTTLVALLSILFGSSAQFGAINCLIPEGSAAKTDEPFSSILALNESRDACLFSNLWNTLQSLESSQVECVSEAVKSPHALKALRESILDTLSLTFKTASLALVLSSVNLTSADDLKQFKIVESADGDKVVFLDNLENTRRDKAQHTENALDYGMVRGLIIDAGVAVE
jgi:translation initiation factor 3 subunit K